MGEGKAKSVEYFFRKFDVKRTMNSRWRRGWGWGGGTPRERAPGEGELQGARQRGEGRVKSEITTGPEA